MVEHISVPVKMIGKERWGQLSVFGLSHLICGETVHQKPDYSFAGGHRVRLYSFKKSVSWKIPDEVDLDISGVTPANAPRRQQRS
jgi:hypothetical protein